MVDCIIWVGLICRGLDFWQDEIGLNEWAIALRTTHKTSQELLSSMARKAGKIYGAEIESNSKHSPVVNRSNGN